MYHNAGGALILLSKNIILINVPLTNNNFKNMSTYSLHDLGINVDGEAPQKLEDFSVNINNASFDSVQVLFRKQEEEIVKLIKEFKNGLILGCIAWLTSKPILTALASCKNVQIVVQKEDFLRPDIGFKNTDSWRTELSKLYKAITCEMVRYDFKAPMNNLSYCADPTVDAIRCVGNHNKDKNPAFPRAHHKFLIFCKITNEKYLPIKVLTGSFNLTKNAVQSFENAVIFTDNSGKSELFEAFINEHHQIFAISEKLNWTESWATPEFRIGS
jgi:hypothetical protein